MNAPIVTISDLKDHVDQEVTIQGWLYHKTGKGKLVFLQMRDGTGICQAVVFRAMSATRISTQPRS